MSDFKTVVLSGSELKVDKLGGKNTVIVNFGSAELYASAYPGIVPDGDSVAAIPAGGAVNLRDTYGTVYLLGTGKVQLMGTDYKTVNVGLTIGSSGGDISGGSELYGDAEFTNTIGGEYAYTVPVVKGETAADTARNYANALGELLGEHWQVTNLTSGARLSAETGARINITASGSNIKFELSDVSSVSADESYSLSQDNAEHYIDVIKSGSRKVICVAFLHTVLINYVFSDYDTAEPYIWQRSRDHDFYRANTLGNLQWLIDCRTCKGDKTALGTGWSGMNGNMYNVFAISCAEDFLKNNLRVFMKLNGKNYAIFGRFKEGLISNTINYRSLLAIPLD